VGQVLHRADASWADLTDPVLQHVATQAVLWVSFSGTLQVFAMRDGLLTRTRVPRRGRSTHLGDGYPVLLRDPAFWSACGCGDGTGYRSTRPLLVAAIDNPREIDDLSEEAGALADSLLAAGLTRDVMPPGHPPDPCGAIYCPRITVDAIR
jgi:hypothetical protein